MMIIAQDIKRAEYLSGFTYNESQQCERPNNTKGPLQCFEDEGYASREKIIFNGDIMHNKFFIVDGKYVWTGSANISDTGIGGYNANIVAYINSSYLAKYYTIEFEQMYLDGNYHKNKKKLKKKIYQFLMMIMIFYYFSPHKVVESVKESFH